MKKSWSAVAFVVLCSMVSATANAGKPEKPPKPPKPPPTLSNPAISFIEDGRKLCVIAADGSASQELVAVGNNQRVHAPAWSAEGRIAYVEWPDRNRWIPCDLKVVNSDGTGQALVRTFPGDPFPPDVYSGLNWFPDGARLLYTGSGFQVIDVDSGDIQDLNVDGSHAALGPDVDPTTPGFQGYVVYYLVCAYPSSDPCDDIAVVFIDEDLATGEFVVDPESFVLDREGSQGLPVFSPDGSHVVFIENQSTLCVVEVEGTVEGFSWGDPQVLYEAPRPIYTKPAFSPDGEWIAFSAYSGPTPGGGWYSDVFRVRPDGTGFAEVTPVDDRSRAQYPSWNPSWIPDLE